MNMSVVAVLGLFGAASAVPLLSQAPVPPTHSLKGIVVDDKEIPIAGAELTISREGRIVAVLRTSETGAFGFDGGPGAIEINTRRIGFRAEMSTIALGRRPSAEVLRIVLETLPAAVAPVLVSGGGGRLALFYQHRKEYAFGRFLEREQIEKSGVRYASDLFRTVPGASLRASRRYGNTIRLRGCQPMLWIDRVPMRDVELDEVAVPEEIAGLEIYTSSSGVPPQFMDRSGRSCGAIVVWTRMN